MGRSIVCVLASVAWLWNLAAAGLGVDAESLFAEAARQMQVLHKSFLCNEACGLVFQVSDG
jgi:hypothetical protein